MAKSKPNKISETGKHREAGSRLVVTGKPTTRTTGCLSLFGDSPEMHRLFAEHLTAEYRVKTEGRGRSVDARCGAKGIYRGCSPE